MAGEPVTPLLLRSDLTDSWWIVTRYAQRGEQITAQTKYDVTPTVDAALAAAHREGFHAALAATPENVGRLAAALEIDWSPFWIEDRAGDGFVDMRLDKRALAAAVLDRLAAEEAGTDHEHVWKSARNAAVVSGEICAVCHLLRAEPVP